MDGPNALGEMLRSIEGSARDFDAGDAGASARIASGLRAVFHQTASSTSLLGDFKAIYTRIASSVPKPPWPHSLFLPLVHVTIDFNSFENQVIEASMTGPGSAGTPRCTPRFGNVHEFRHVQAPDWWKSEPAFLINRTKITRRDLTLWAVGDESSPHSRMNPPVHSEIKRLGRMAAIKFPTNGGGELEIPFMNVQAAALRQIAHEVLKSPELFKLAGGTGLGKA
ncbi:MAG: hypothetical protein NVSMB9_11800 [Isosphaeraceae bacterium]